MKRSKTKLLEITARQGQAARAELLAMSERLDFYRGSVRYLCDVAGVAERDDASAVVAAAERIRALQLRSGELDKVRGEAVRVVLGCTDFGGGYRDDALYAAFRHGIDTCGNAVRAWAASTGGYQTAVLLAIGAERERAAEVAP